MTDNAVLLFIACTEPGALEHQSVLLFESIRRSAGRFSEAPILSFQPRRGIDLDSSTKTAFRELEVEHRTDVLNTEFEREPHVNKVFAGEWCERHRTEDVIVFADSDSFFTAEPTELELRGPAVAAVRPGGSSWARKLRAVSDRLIGRTPILGYTQPTSANRNPETSYWDVLHELCHAPVGLTVLTDINPVPARGYWNSGLVAVRREAEIFGHWLANYRTLVAAQHFPAPLSYPKVLEQAALAPALSRFPGRIKVLDKRYNYPLQLRGELEEPFRSAELEELVHVHYYDVFRDPNFLQSVEPPFGADSDTFRWLHSHRVDLLESPAAQQLAHHKRKLATARRRVLKQRNKRYQERVKRRRAEHSRDDAIARLDAVRRSRWWRLGERLNRLAKAVGC